MGPLTKTVSCKNATFMWSLVSPDAPKAESQSFLQSLRFWSPKPTPLIVETPAEEEAFELRDVTLSCEPGLTLIFGPTGSGKSSLLNALLGEMDLLKGEHNLPKLPGHYDPATGLHGGISYCAQQSWLQQRSIRDNILFGSPFEQERYEQVLEACALNPDLAIFEDGDMQEIGEGGISLSGGQKARCALARAVYSRARTVLLDDVLSAVDSHTAEHIVRNCLQGPLMKNRCIVLVTHHVELVTPIAFHAIKIEEGRIVASGSPQELRTAGLLQDLAELEQSNEGEQEAEKTPTAKPKLGVQDGKEARKLVEKEERQTGSVKWSIYLMYFRACGILLLSTVVLHIALGKAVNTAAQFWLSYWAQSDYEEESKPAFTLLQRVTISRLFPPASQSPGPYIVIYGLIQLAEAVVLFSMVVFTYLGTLRASSILFRRMLDSVSRATARWIDKTPSGRILNRFARDIEVLDTSLLNNVRSVAQYGFNLLGSLVILAISLPAFMVPAAFLLYAYLSRELLSQNITRKVADVSLQSPCPTSRHRAISAEWSRPLERPSSAAIPRRSRAL